VVAHTESVRKRIDRMKERIEGRKGMYIVKENNDEN
jgi:hypothetical protein